MPESDSCDTSALDGGDLTPSLLHGTCWRHTLINNYILHKRFKNLNLRKKSTGNNFHFLSQEWHLLPINPHHEKPVWFGFFSTKLPPVAMIAKSPEMLQVLTRILATINWSYQGHEGRCYRVSHPNPTLRPQHSPTYQRLWDLPISGDDRQACL